MMKQGVLTAALLFLAAFLNAEEWTVDVPLLNVRIAPSGSSFAVGTLSAGEKLVPLADKDGWCAVAAPKTVRVWVARCFLDKENRFLKGARLRTLPGAYADPFDFVPPEHAKAEILETAADGFWVRIAPPEGLRCFVWKHYLKEPTAEPKPAEESESADAPESVSKAAAEGRLMRLTEPVSGATHQLVQEINGEVIPTSLVEPGKLNLLLWERRRIRIEGVLRWRRGMKIPFLEAEKIVPSWR